MARYILQRLLLMVPTLLGVVTVVFFSLHLVPGDPVDLMIPPDLGGAAREAMAAQIRAQYGLDKPLWEQYVTYLEKLLHGDFGRSLRNGTLISQDLMRRVPNTLQLGLLAFVISTALGLLVGVVAATHKDRVWDRLSMVVALLGVSLPNFWLGFMLMLLFGLYWKVLPPTGFGGSIFTWEGLRYAILPALTLAASTTGVVARFTRSSMLEVIRHAR
ncbi:MAG: ABC transporter permease [Clostridiales bacterium]|nr:ABC transporter permease [Clostridiales bacterium]